MSSSRIGIIVVENFYSHPEAVRKFALQQAFYTPYENKDAVRMGKIRATWWASKFRRFEDCPFKSSQTLIAALEGAVSEVVDLDHWRAVYPVDANSLPLPNSGGGKQTCLWNCCFHVKPDNGQKIGDGVHNHVTDGWNSVGTNGWAGIIYLNPASPIEGGLHLWRNIDSAKQHDWMTPAKNWEHIDSFGNVFNRLILVRGDIPHSGACGWGNRLENGRLYQTFFFRTMSKPSRLPVSMLLTNA